MEEQPTFFELEAEEKDQGPVECLGMTFENDEKCREYFLENFRGQRGGKAFIVLGREMNKDKLFNLFTEQVGKKPVDLLTDQVDEKPADLYPEQVEPLKSLNETQWRIVSLCEVPKTLAEIMEVIGVGSRHYFKTHHLDPLIKGNVIKMTNPGKPRASNQKYVLTETGIQLKINRPKGKS